jgi:EAL and modified HD-GYP domain-containing signal transduction protein
MRQIAQPEVFLGRQPIFDRARNVVACELLFRASDRHTNACVTDGAVATACVIDNAFRIFGIDSVVGRATAFVNVDVEFMLSRTIESLPRDRVVLEILETVEVDKRLLRRCRQLKARGYRMALDDFPCHDGKHAALLDIADIVKIDLIQTDSQSLLTTVAQLKRRPLQLLAEKVDNIERARRCLALGFELFQGFLFGQPTLLTA